EYIVKPTEDEKGIIITAQMTKAFLFFDVEPRLGPGIYKGKIGDKEVMVDSKIDLKLFEFNASKLEE
ncbi:MAG: hypothetical protein ACE5J5_07300, partial [Candidatus Hydrothermarchaeales archaeon]